MSEDMNESNAAHHRKMTETPIPKLIMGLSLPPIASMLITSLYNMADTYFVSSLGESATGAVGVVFSVMAIIQAVGFALGMGSGAQISGLLGAKKQEEAETVAITGFFMALVFGAGLTVLGLAFLDPLMDLLGATETILPYARVYARYILLGAPIMGGVFVMNNLLRAEGHSFLSMIGVTSGGILNMVLDPIFIFGFDMGIAGAAIATVLSQCVSFAILLSFFLMGKSMVRLRPRCISRRGMTYVNIIRTGLPSLCRQSLAAIATAALNTAARPYGDAAIAAMSVVGRIFQFIQSVLIGFGQGYQPVMGYNYGAQRPDRMRQALRFVMAVGFISMGVLATGCAVKASWLMGCFGENPTMIEIGTFAVRAQCIGLLLQPLGMYANMTFQTIRQTGKATVLSACRQGIFFLPLILILPGQIGLLGVQLAQPLADVLTSLVSAPLLLSFERGLKAQEAAMDRPET